MDGERVDWSVDDIARHLKASPFLHRVDDAAIRRVAESATVTAFRAGDLVMVEGEPGAEAFVVVAGRLDVLTGPSGGDQKVVSHLGPGDVVGEMSLITAEPRSATVRARRDSALMRISADDFNSMVLDHPAALLEVTRTVVDRLNRSIHGHRPESTRKVVAIVPAGTEPDHSEFSLLFADNLGSSNVEVVTSASVERDLGIDASPAKVAEYLHRIEDENAFAVLVGDPDDADWTQLCQRQADISLLVGRVGGLPRKASHEVHPPDGDGNGRECQLVILHPDGSASGTAAILPLRNATRHHHVRCGSEADARRVARIVKGESVGIVFGGGGARGLAHLGVLKAMMDANVAIDHVGGTSIGASVAAGYAMGLEWERMVELQRNITVDRGSPVDATFPAVSIARGKRLAMGMQEAAGGVDIEDLWTEFFCVSADLTIGDVRIHSSGPVWRAVRASIAIPGVFAPMRSADGHVLVDGGVLDNLPVSTMRDAFQPSKVIAVDLRAHTTMPAADLPDDGELSGWRVIGNRILPWRDSLDTPSIFDVLIAASMVSGRSSAALADVVLRPPVEEFAILDFTRHEEIIDAGYRYASEALSEGVLDPV